MNRPMFVKSLVAAASIAATLCIAMATSISAQVLSGPSPPAEAVLEQQRAAPLEEKKIAQFAEAYLAVEEVHLRTADELNKATDRVAANKARDKAETQMIQAIERNGLHVQEFNRIVELCALDPALRTRVADKVEERRRI
jgi:hypothetical protein